MSEKPSALRHPRPPVSPPAAEVDRFHRPQPAIPIPRRQLTVDAPRGAIAYSLLGGRVISRLG